MTKAEEFIKDYSRGCSNELYFGEGIDKQYERWLTPDQALCAVEIEKEELIGKACEWLQSHDEMDFSELLPYNYCGATVFHKDKMIESFRKAMEEQL